MASNNCEKKEAEADSPHRKSADLIAEFIRGDAWKHQQVEDKNPTVE